VGCSLCTCKGVEEMKKGETHVLARLASPSGGWRGDGCGRMTCA
jgi:hypothetical protein